MRGAYVFLKNNGVTIGFATGAFLALLSVLIMVAGFPKDASEEILYGSSIFDFAIIVTFILICAGLIAALVGPAIYMAMNFKESIKFLVIFGGLLLLFGISYTMRTTPGEQELIFFQGVDNKHLLGSDIAFVDCLLIFSGIMIFLTFVALAFMFVWGILKQR